jgi:hypothetical protein
MSPSDKRIPHRAAVFTRYEDSHKSNMLMMTPPTSSDAIIQ